MSFVLTEFGNMSKHTFVDKVFGGVFISSVLCHDCHVVRSFTCCIWFLEILVSNLVSKYDL